MVPRKMIERIDAYESVPQTGYENGGHAAEKGEIDDTEAFDSNNLVKRTHRCKGYAKDLHCNNRFASIVSVSTTCCLIFSYFGRSAFDQGLSQLCFIHLKLVCRSEFYEYYQLLFSIINQNTL